MAARYELIVVAGESSSRHPLPRSGAVVVGRADDCDVAIADESVSRHHAVIHLGDELEIEELGSVNGTTVRGDAIAGRTAFAVADPITLGKVTIRIVDASRRRRIWIHDYFEARVDDECVRAARTGGGFAIVRLITAPDHDGVAEIAAVNAVRVDDVVGRRAPGDFEILLVDAPPPRAAAVVEHVRADLASRGIDLAIGIASYPNDGRDATSLDDASARRAIGRPPLTIAAITPLDPMPAIHDLVARIAPSRLNVIVLGETGVGKEVLARRIHEASDRAAAPHVRLNCAALSEPLLDSELFGHERGSFTGAIATKPGLLETADGGTVFLDEIGELPVGLQAKLLRVIEQREVLRVGGLKTRPIDVRFIAATNRNLEREVERKAFREDLYFRLNGVTIRIPPLRERVGEIAGLARQFVAAFARDIGRAGAIDLSADAIARLEAHSWPGNIRELRNVIERAVVLCHDDRIAAEHLPALTSRRAATEPAAHRDPAPAPRPRHHAIAARAPARSIADDLARLEREAEALERRRIEEALAACGGNQTHAARALGISRGTLIKRLEKYAVIRPRRRQ